MKDKAINARSLVTACKCKLNTNAAQNGEKIKTHFTGSHDRIWNNNFICAKIYAQKMFEKSEHMIAR